MAYSTRKYIVAFCLVLFLLAAYKALSLYKNYGITWDFIAHYLDGLAFFNPNFYHKPITLYPNTFYAENSNYYFEISQAPLSSLILGTFSILFGINSVPVYIVFLLICLLLSIFLISKEININPLILSSFLFLYVTSIIVFSDSEDVLSLLLILITIWLLLKKKTSAGAALSLATLAKYTSFVFIPLLLLLPEKKKIVKSYLLFFLVLLPWLLFNQYYFKSIVFSYAAEFFITFISTLSTKGSIESLLYPILYPIIGVIIAVFIYATNRKTKRNRKLNYKIQFIKLFSDYKFRAFLACLIFAIIYEFIIIWKYEGFDAIRMSNFFYLIVSIAATVLIEKVSLRRNIRIFEKQIAVSSAVIVVFFVFSILALTILYNTYTANYANSLSQSSPSFFSTVRKDLSYYYLSNCDFVSNKWIYLLYYNISAYPPYYLDNITLRYPILIFPTGVGDYNINTTNYYKISLRNFTMYLPPYYICTKDRII